MNQRILEWLEELYDMYETIHMNCVLADPKADCYAEQYGDGGRSQHTAMDLLATDILIFKQEMNK